MPVDIQNVVVLMLENRSFDHMLGFLDHPNEEFPALSNESNPDRDGSAIRVSRSATATIAVSPGHEHHEVLKQLAPSGVFDNSGFVRQYEELAESKGVADAGPEIMRCQHPDNVPVLATLAKEYAVCTRWFCSVPGMTWPNRNFAHAATSDGEVDIVKRFYTNRTIFEDLSANGKDWRVFSDNDALTPQVKCFGNLLISDWRNRFQGVDSFLRRAAMGTLPHYSFIEPDHLQFYPFERFSSSQHPMNNINSDGDFRAGEKLIRKVYQAMRANEESWYKSLLIITYDEHGGFYDREVPPIHPEYAVDETHSEFDFQRLGPRVPAVVVSPLIDRRTIVDTVFDHTSIVKTIRRIHIPGTPPLSRREANVNELTGILSRTSPRTDTVEFPLESPAPGPGPESFVAPVPSGANLASMRESEVAVPSPEIDEFQESLLWLNEEITGNIEIGPEVMTSGIVAHNVRHPDLDDTASRLSLVRDQSRDAFRKSGQRLVILRCPDGNVIERPTHEDIDAAVHPAPKVKVWIEDLPDSVLEWLPGGLLRLQVEEQEHSKTTDVEDARNQFKRLCDGDLDLLISSFTPLT